ncbi:MAG: sulfite exporter TauE/SafE family protein, partial [Candidatus Choladocola sp.]|nr:sulfite exporter TauE/SafE family protein [Candidatus Choladocola sp.]
TSLVVFLFNGQIILPLGFAAAVCHMAGSYLGSGLVLAKGAKIVRPIIIIVLFLLLLKILGIF